MDYDIPTKTISLEYYEELVRDSAELAALYAAGVDNWEGYDEALDAFHERMN